MKNGFKKTLAAADNNFVYNAMAEMENEYKKYLKLLLGLFGIILLTIIFITIDGIINPQPSFREICESNGGIFIENHGRAGNSCIYNKEK